MLQDVFVKLGPGLPWQSSIQQEDYFYLIVLKFKKETSKVLHLGYSFVWCWNLDTSERRSEIPEKF
jgi:hypothetical protein